MTHYTFTLFAIILGTTTGWAFDLQGHRGARAIYPEHSMQGFAYAIEIGVKTLEADVHVTRDNVLVLSHDPYLTSPLCEYESGRPIVKPILIRSVTFLELKQVVCGRKGHPSFPNQKSSAQKIMSLTQLFEMVESSIHSNANKVQFNLETKLTPGRPNEAPSPEDFVDLLFKALNRRKMVQRTILQSFDFRTLKIAKSRNPKLKIAILTADNLLPIASIAKNLKADIVSPHFDWITEDLVNQLHQQGIKVIPYTVNNPNDFNRVFKLGVDGVITDDPAAIQKLL